MPGPKRKCNRLSTEKKARFIGSVEAGLTIRAAGNLHGIPPSTAIDLAKKWRETGSVSNKQVSGRKKKTTERGRRALIGIAKKHRRLPFTSIGNMMTPKISKNTVRRELKEAGFARRKARRVPYLTKLQKKNHLLWAKELAGWDDEDFGNVLYTDETYIGMGDTAGDIYITRRPAEILKDECTVPSFTQSSVRVMVWGCIAIDHKGPLIILEYPGGEKGGMNAARYQAQVLDPVVEDYVMKLLMEKGYLYYQQDGAPGHRANVTKKWFQDREIMLFPHPASSPDMNPIEPIWHVLKDAIRNRPHPPTSRDELIAAIHEEWDRITVHDINKYVGQMAKRVQAVLDAKGGSTPY